MASAAQYAVGRTGPLASMGLFVGAMIRSDPRFEWPDLQINMFAWSTKERLRTGIVPHPFSAFRISPVHLRPDGRGPVRLQSADPTAAPAIRFNFLQHQTDFQAFIHRLPPHRQI